MLSAVSYHATGDLFPATDWNTFVADNMNWLIKPGANIVAIAGVLPITNEWHTVTGGGSVNTLAVTSPVAGQRVRLFCTAATTFTNGVGNVFTINGTSRVTIAGEYVEFQCYDGTNFREVIPQAGVGPIYDNLLAGNATSISTGTLPTTYKHLLIITRSRTDSATAYPTTDLLRMRINGDTAANYDSVDGAGGVGTGEASMRVGNHAMGTSGAGLFTVNIILIPDYNSAANRKVVNGISSAGFSTNNSASAPIGVFNAQGSWRTNNTPITSLTFLTGPTVGTTNIVTGSRFSVYGLN